VSSAARSGLPLWLAISAAIEPPPSVEGVLPLRYEVVLREERMQPVRETATVFAFSESVLELFFVCQSRSLFG